MLSTPLPLSPPKLPNLKRLVIIYTNYFIGQDKVGVYTGGSPDEVIKFCCDCHIYLFQPVFLTVYLILVRPLFHEMLNTNKIDTIK